jgi:hypothetical protein
LLLGVGNGNFLEKDTERHKGERFNFLELLDLIYGNYAPIFNGYQLTNGIFGGSWLCSSVNHKPFPMRNI